MDDRWEELERRCQGCRECSLCETRTNVVFGVGSRTAEILFVGEGPGANEDAQGASSLSHPASISPRPPPSRAKA